MKILMANSSKQAVGGGWSFIANFKKGMGDLITEDYTEATHYFISGATMVTRDEVQQAKDDGKKIVLRIDNAVRNSRNRNTGMTRMYDFAGMADLVVYQSTWSREYLSPFLNRTGKIILNGTDTKLYNPEGRTEAGITNYLYSRYNRDETKNWEMARYTYSLLHSDTTFFNIVGQFSPELADGNFDFYQTERFKFWGVQTPEVLADIYKQTDYFLYSYFNDCCSNTLIEALCSGCEIIDVAGMLKTGGAMEIMHMFDKHGGSEYFSLDRMCREYKEALENV